jgi:ribonuclease-3
MRICTFPIYLIISYFTLGQSQLSSAMEHKERAQELTAKIGYKFQDVTLWDKVFSHSGIAQTNQVPFGRLEFLGDKVLGLAISRRLCELYPTQGEGFLTQTLATLVSNENNARIAGQLGLQTYIQLNPDHKKTGEGLPKILADTCEALIGAIYEDGGQESAEKFIFRFWKVDSIEREKEKLALVPNSAQKESQKSSSTPFEIYRLAHKLPSHQFKCMTKKAPFQVQLCYGDVPFTDVCTADTKSQAKKLAAAQALVILQRCDFPKISKGKTKTALLELLQAQAIKPSVNGMSRSPAKPPAAVSQKSSAVVSKTVILASAYPTTVSSKKAKEKLGELCLALKLVVPTYSVVSEVILKETVSRVTIENVGYIECSGKKAQAQAAQAMYKKITGYEIGVKKAKEALEQVCGDKKLATPLYSMAIGEFTVQAVIEGFRETAVSSKSCKDAEKLAAAKLYETLRKTLK